MHISEVEDNKAIGAALSREPDFIPHLQPRDEKALATKLGLGDGKFVNGLIDDVAPKRA